MDKAGTPLNGGTILSWPGCELHENKNGIGPARVTDAPLFYIDALNDVVCSCSYPRCFGGRMTSSYEFTDGMGEAITLKGLLGIDKDALPVLRGKASQSSVGYGMRAEHAVDGNTNGEFWARSCTTTRDQKYDPDPWWKLDFASKKMVTKVKVWNRSDGIFHRLNGVQVSVDGDVCGTLTGTTAVQTITCNPPKAGSEVRLAFAGEGKRRLNFCEVKAYGQDYGLPLPTPSPTAIKAYVNIEKLFPALKRKLKACCAQKTKHYIDYARQTCGEHAIQDVCKAPNGYEPRFDSEGLGAAKHFPKSPCVAEAWAKFGMLEVIDKTAFAQEENEFAGWAKRIREHQPCKDNDEGVKIESKGNVPDCATAVGFCTDATNGEIVRKNCPNICGVCPGTGLQQVDLDLEDALAGKSAARQHAWTLTPTAASWTHSPTTDQSCFVDPESFDCSCMNTLKRNCRYVHECCVVLRNARAVCVHLI